MYSPKGYAYVLVLYSQNNLVWAFLKLHFADEETEKNNNISN